MKVLFVMPHVRAGGGLSESTFDLLPALRALGAEPSVVCQSDKKPSMRVKFEERGIPVTVLRGSPVAKVRDLRRIIQSREIDVVHTAIPRPTILARLASAGLPVAVVTSIIDTFTGRGGRVGVAYRWTQRLTDRFHANSLAAQTYAVRELGIPEPRITVVERGRNLEKFGSPSVERRLRARAALGIAPDTPVILTVGRHEPQKDQVTLLAAFDRLAPSHPDALLLIAGREGKSTALLTRHRDLSAHGDRVRILGQRADVPDLLAAADVFAFPSSSEGFGGAAVEAMALGLPVVASDIPVLREVVTEGVTGTFAPVRDPDAFAAAIGGLLDDPQRARALGGNGRQRFLERYTIERSAERMLDLYEQVLPARSRARAEVTG